MARSSSSRGFTSGGGGCATAARPFPPAADRRPGGSTGGGGGGGTPSLPPPVSWDRPGDGVWDDLSRIFAFRSSSVKTRLSASCGRSLGGRGTVRTRGCRSLGTGVSSACRGAVSSSVLLVLLLASEEETGRKKTAVARGGRGTVLSFSCSSLHYLSHYTHGLVPVFRTRIFKRLWSPGIDSKEWIPPT